MVENIYSFLHPMFIASKIVGLCPLKYNSQRRYEKTYLGLLWSMIFGITMFALSEYTVVNYMFIYTNMIQRIISIIMVQINLFIAFLSSFIFYFNTNKVNDKYFMLDKDLKRYEIVIADYKVGY